MEWCLGSALKKLEIVILSFDLGAHKGRLRVVDEHVARLHSRDLGVEIL